MTTTREHPAKTIARWVALGGLFLVPFTALIVTNSYFFPFITGKAFFFRIAVEIAFAGWAVLAFMDKRYRPRSSWVTILLVALVAWMFVADLFAVNPAKAFWSNFERMEGWITLIHLLAFFIVASTVLRVEKKWRAWWYTSLIAALYVMAYGFLQLSGVAAIHQGNTRIDASLGNAAYLAVYMLFHVFVAGWLALTTKRKWLRWGLLGYAVLAAWILFGTATRGTILGLAGGLFLAALLTAFTMGKRVRGYATAAVVLLVLIGGGFLMAKDTSFVRHDPVLSRIASISLAAGDTRFTIWHMAFEGATQSPKNMLLGWGQEGFNYVFNKYYDPSLYNQEQWFDRAHNAFIDWLVQGGLPAFLLYIGLFGAALYLLWRSPFARAEQIALTALLAGYAFHNLFVFDNITSYIAFVAVLALIDSNVGKPIRALEKAPEVSEASAGIRVWPIAGAALLAVVMFIDVPGMRAAGELITALSAQQSTPAQNIAVWKDELAHPAFASQEIREQLLTFAMQVAQQQGVQTTDKEALANLALTQMQKEADEVPQDARIRFELAVGYAAFGDYKDALTQIQITHELSPKKETVFLEEGAIQLGAGNLAGAAKAFKEAYALGPQFKGLAAYGAAGDVLQGDRTAADAILQKTFGTTTVDNPALVEAYALTKQYAPLIAIYRARVAKPGSTVDDSFRLAVAEAAAGEIQKAVAQVRTTIAAHPEAKQAGETLITQIQEGKVQ